MPPKYDRRAQTQRTEGRSNLVGKFTTSVRRFVQDVEFDHTREGAVQTSERVFMAQQKVTNSYNTVKNALIQLHERYEASKTENNMLQRYQLFKKMVKEVISLDTQYWVLLELPRQEKQEQVNAYVLRACATLEKASESRTQDASARAAAEEALRDRKQRLDGSNLVGKFTTSVKKFVQDVEFDHTREGAVQTSERVFMAQQKVTNSYNTVKNALIQLHERYEASKTENNMLQRYQLFKKMVKEVISLDTQYWVLLELPRQEKQEQVNAYVLRACATLEKASESRTQDASARAAAEEALRDRKQRLDGMSVQEIEDENSQSINDLYRLLKKYGNLRSIVHSLQVAYTDSKVYPFVPRYSMLKDMIKCVLREPGYMEVCHEDISRT